MIAAALLVLYDTPGKRLPSLHAQVFAPLRSVLDACRWHAAPFDGQRTATGFFSELPSVSQRRGKGSPLSAYRRDYIGEKKWKIYFRLA